MGKGVIVSALLAASFAFTDPGPRQHRQAAIQHIRETCGPFALAEALCGAAAGIFGRTAAGADEYHDHLLYSTGRFGNVETVGVMGRVVVVGG